MLPGNSVRVGTAHRSRSSRVVACFARVPRFLHADLSIIEPPGVGTLLGDSRQHAVKTPPEARSPRAAGAAATRTRRTEPRKRRRARIGAAARSCCAMRASALDRPAKPPSPARVLREAILAGRQARRGADPTVDLLTSSSAVGVQRGLSARSAASSAACSMSGSGVNARALRPPPATVCHLLPP